MNHLCQQPPLVYILPFRAVFRTPFNPRHHGYRHNHRPCRRRRRRRSHVVVVVLTNVAVL